MVHAGKFIDLVCFAVPVNVDATQDLSLAIFFPQRSLRVDSDKNFTGWCRCDTYRIVYLWGIPEESDVKSVGSLNIGDDGVSC